MKKHVATLCKHEFPGGFCEQTLNTFQKLKKYGIKLKIIISFLIILLYMILKLFYLKPKLKKLII
jgi:hypothetical protein